MHATIAEIAQRLTDVQGELVRAQGGTIHAESAGEGKGSTFVVTFPAARA